MSPPLALRALCVVSILGVSLVTEAQDEPRSSDQLKRLSIEELMNVEVTSVSRRPEKISKSASAIQVISREDILRSGATNLPEALRLVSNLQVAQLSAQHWIISARGFNAVFSNKLLVMIDGRTVYSPLFAGVFWDAQSVVLEDIERIEIISGPGGTMWGANAVNGVINIITRTASETPGAFVSAGSGTVTRNMAQGRFGGRLGQNGAFRIYAQHHNRDVTQLPDGTDNDDAWSFTQAGFRADWSSGTVDEFLLTGNAYRGTRQTSPQETTIDGQNMLGRWTHSFSDRSRLTTQLYFDRTWRDDAKGAMKDQLNTYDADIQHNLTTGRHQVVWGGGFRFVHDETINTTDFVGLIPKDRDMELITFFGQDEFSITDHFRFVFGTKLQHNEFSGWDVQPSARLAWQPNDTHFVWTAVSRAVRAPSRIDVDYHLPAFHVPPHLPSVDGGPNFVSEKLTAYELGYRVQPGAKGQVSVSLFSHEYDDLYSVELLPGTLTYQIMNGTEGHSMGVEVAAQIQVTDYWRVRGGYTWFDKTLRNKPGNTTPESALADLGADANNLAVLQSILDLPANFQFDLAARYTDELPPSENLILVPRYTEITARLAWNFRNFEFALVGQNLLNKYHAEYSGIEIPRNIYGTITWRP